MTASVTGSIRSWLRRARSRPWPVHPVLFGAYFILFLLSQNLGEVTWQESLPWVVLAAIGSAAVTLATGILFGDLRRGALVAAAIVVCFFGYGHIAAALRPLRIPSLAFPLGWVALIAIAAIVAVRGRERVLPLTRALNTIAAVLIVVTLATIVPYELSRKPTVGLNPVDVGPTGASGGRKPDVYYLILDRHANDATLDAVYGVQSPLTDRLRASGFTVLDHAYANYMRTHLSLASSMNMSYLDQLTEDYGRESNDVQSVFKLLQDDAVGQFLKGQGYRYIHTGSSYQPTSRSALADENPQRSSDTDFSRVLFDTTVLPGIARRVTNGRDPDRDRLYETARWQWGELARIRDEPGPKYVFSHFLLPHPPYIFDRDGSYVDEATEKSRTEADNYGRQVAYTDAQVLDFIAPLVALPPDQRPIIVIQADEGPFPRRYALGGGTWDWTQATDAEREQKFGILDAILLPGDGPQPAPSMTPVNTFRFLFDRYFGANLPLLPDRVYISRTAYRAFDFIDITEELRWGPELLGSP
ncbi:MAG TPA: sulfatase-like hydrolase/transferase [Candidatus Limnocylindrales bacterium]|nr:sulfatase-like hydrolase/transferase [Candidatus Limnocylindrales bacterium]